MYATLTFCHSIMRWLLLAALICSIVRAYTGYKKQRTFLASDNAIRHWTATIAHIQLMIGILLYTQSPIVRYFWKHTHEIKDFPDGLFFSVIHMLLMLGAVTVITIGSALARRRDSDRQKFYTMFCYYLIALLIIFIAVPWPFSPLAVRPYFRYA